MRHNDKIIYVKLNQLILFFTIPTATEPQEVHDEYMQYVNDVHWYGMNKLKVFVLL